MQRALFLATAVLLLDQLTKWAVLVGGAQPRHILELTGFFNLVLTYNTGVSFGLFQGGAAWQPYILVALNTAVAVGLLIWLRREQVKAQAENQAENQAGNQAENQAETGPEGQTASASLGLLPWAIGLVVGGALGNAIDRLHQPGVVDFLDFHLAGWHWPAFNVADSGIVCGVALIIADGLFQPGRKSKRGPGRGR